PGVVEIADAGSATRFVYRGTADTLAAALEGADVSRTLRAARAAEITALRLGPDEWLVFGSPSRMSVARMLLVQAQAAGTASVVDISDRNFAITIAGPRAADLLASGCPLDFDPASFPVGMCTRTIFGKAEVVLWRMGADKFRLEAGRSFAPYVTGLLDVSLRGLPPRA
ncbi:MAG: sarcosine oxidase subunit gamma, partial [Hyphomicrobiales bacterium]